MRISSSKKVEAHLHNLPSRFAFKFNQGFGRLIWNEVGVGLRRFTWRRDPAGRPSNRICSIEAFSSKSLKMGIYFIFSLRNVSIA